MPYINKNVDPTKNKNKKENKIFSKNPLGEKWDFSGIFVVLAVEAVEKSLTYVSDRWDSQCPPHCNRSAVQSLGFYPSLLRKPCGERYFLVPNKKVTKEVGLGEALTVKPIGTSTVSFPFYPAFKPSSPKTLSRPPSLPGYESICCVSS